MRRPRIALVVPSLVHGGGVPAVARFIKGIVEASGEFELVPVSLATSMRDANSVSAFRPWTWINGITVSEGTWEGLPYRHVGAFACEFEFMRFRSRPALNKVLSDCDLIQVVSGSPAWALPVLGLGKPVVLQVATRAVVERRRRERVERGPASWWRWCMTRITNGLDDRALRGVDAVLVENQWMLDYAIQLRSGGDGSVRLAPPGVDTNLFHPLRERGNNRSERDYILAVGRFDDERKNVDMLLDAYAQLHETVSNPPRLRLAGAGGCGAEFWKKVTKLKLESEIDFHFKPGVEELAGYYQRATCFALSSDEEGFGIVIAEAMASGIPVVATRCGGPNGIITDGVDGCLVIVGDSNAMADRLRMLVQDVRRNRDMGAAARRTALERFSTEVAGEAFLGTYRRLLAGR